MAMHFSPDVVSNGLILNLDVNSVRSYAGPPIQNMADIINPNGVTDTNIQYTTGFEEVTVPTLGKIPSVPFVDGYNSNSSSYCCMQQFYFRSNNGFVTCSGSTTYTYSIVYKVTSGYTHPNFMYRYEFTSGGSYLGEAGVHDDAKRVHLGNGWYWAWNTFTTNASAAQLYLRCFYYQYNVSDRFYVARVLVTPGDYTTYHPRLWPALGTTRGTTEVLRDSTRGNTVTVGGPLTYGTDKITVPNTNDASISVSPSTNFRTVTQDFTISCWIKQLDSGIHLITEARDSSTLQGYLFALNIPSAGYVGVFLNKSSGQVPYYTTVGTLPVGSVQNIVAVVKRSNSTIEIYANGALFDTITGIHSDSISGLGDMYRIGYDRGGATTNMELYSYMHYNRALSLAEIQQNFNAHKGRYGL